MAKKSAKESPNKSAFIRGALEEKRDAKLADVNAAWNAAGHAGEIGSALYYNVKGKSKRKGKRGHQLQQGADNGAATTSAANSYAIIERDLDRLVAEAEQLKDSALADAIRAARRRASAKLV